MHSQVPFTFGSVRLPLEFPVFDIVNSIPSPGYGCAWWRAPGGR